MHTDGVGTTDFVGVGLTRALPEHVGQAIQLSVEDTYQRFVGLVGKGRGLSPEEAEKAAEGRVWTGQDAKELGLVDEFGNLDDALKAAAELANLKSWQVTPIAPEESARDKFLRELFDSSAQALAPHLQSWLPAGLGKALVEMNRSLDPLTRFNDPQGTYAFCRSACPDPATTTKNRRKAVFLSSETHDYQLSNPASAQCCNSASTRVSRTVHWDRGRPAGSCRSAGPLPGQTSPG